MFVKSIDTFPALALSEVLLYLSSPSRLASKLSAVPLAEVPVEVEEEVLGVVAGVAGVEDELDVEPLLEEPQPAASGPRAPR